MILIKPFRWEHRYKNIAHQRTFFWNVFTNFDILEQFVGLVPMQTTAIDKDISKAKMQCTMIKVLKVQLFSSISSIKKN